MLLGLSLRKCWYVLLQVAAGGAGGWCIPVCGLRLPPSSQSHTVGQSSSCPPGSDTQRSNHHPSARVWAVRPERFPQVGSGYKWLVIWWLQPIFFKTVPLLICFLLEDVVVSQTVWQGAPSTSSLISRICFLFQRSNANAAVLNNKWSLMFSCWATNPKLYQCLYSSVVSSVTVCRFHQGSVV